MIPAARHRREGHLVLFAFVLHGGAAFGDGELRRAVDAGGGCLNEVGVGEVVFFEPPQEISCCLEVVMLSVVSAFAVDLGVGCGGLGRGVDNCVWFVDCEEFVDEGFVCEVAFDKREVREVVGLFGGVEASLDGVDGRRRDGADLVDPLTAREVVDE